MWRPIIGFNVLKESLKKFTVKAFVMKESVTVCTIFSLLFTCVGGKKFLDEPKMPWTKSIQQHRKTVIISGLPFIKIS